MQYKQALVRHLQDNISIYVFTIVLFVMGIIFGAVIVNSLPYDAKNDLYHYLNQFFTEMNKGAIAAPNTMLGESFSHSLQYLGFIWILGLSIIGLPIVFILLFIKGIVVGFTVGFLVNQMGLHGFWLALVSVFPQNLMIIPTFIIVSTASVAFSLRIIRQLLMKSRKEPLFPQFTRYAGVMFGILAIAFVVALYEAYLSPVLIKGVVG
ncbi:stage II sporulation protein M [Tuberibacillus sp. Marseille-P3662]|uniref:stage II sporulation protein M n=1 Tax=Tuberibacillus sp. Marseille-P3662 TaxID=1965358 RepID=UPI000A1CA798|nr:stage II sporulation protein M [Tuberibacillus sp. Marseille-P3662]